MQFSSIFHKRMSTDQTHKNKFTGGGFLIATIGAAIGLGNIWKFPYLIAKYGGTFFFPFIIGLLIIGLPILILEINIGKRFQRSNVSAFKKLNKNAEIFGWFQTMIVGIIAIYYAVVIGWSLIAFIKSFIPSLFANAAGLPGFDAGIIINNFANPGTAFSSINYFSLIALFAVWIFIGVILIFGIRRGIQKINLILLPLLFILLIGLTVYVCTLSGASSGLDYLFRIDWSQLNNFNIWQAAFGQVFFSLCLAGGAIICYARYTSRSQDVNNSALIIVSTNTLVAIVMSIMIFAALGYCAHQAGQNFSEWFQSNQNMLSGPALLFIVMPKIFGIISLSVGYFGNILAIAFFLVIIFAGFTSILSMSFAFIDNIKTKFGYEKSHLSTIIYCVISFCLGIIFTTNIGNYCINITDFWVSQNLLIISGAIEVFLIVIYLRRLKLFTTFGNLRSLWRVGSVYDVTMFLAPFILMSIWGLSLVNNFQAANFSWSLNMFLLAGFVTFILIVLSTVFAAFIFLRYSERISAKHRFLIYSIFDLLIPLLVIAILIVISFNIVLTYGGTENIFASRIAGIIYGLAVPICGCYLLTALRWNKFDTNENIVTNIKTAPII